MAKNVNDEPLNAANIDVSLIDENPDNEKIFNMDDIDDLAKDIKENGFLGAIYVFKKPNGRYEVSAGHRRLRAVKQLGHKTIPCVISDMPDDASKGLKLLATNIRIRKMRPMDWARAIEYYHKIYQTYIKPAHHRNDKPFVVMAGEFFNMSSSQLYLYRALNSLNKNLQKLADNPDFPFSPFARAATLLSEEEQVELYHRVNKAVEERKNKLDEQSDEELNSKEGLSRSQLDRIINDIVRERERAERKQERGEEESSSKGPEFESLDESLEASAIDDFNLIEDDVVNDESEISTEMDELYSSIHEQKFGHTSEDEFDTYTQEINKLTLGSLKLNNKKKIKEYINIFQQAIELLEKML